MNRVDRGPGAPPRIARWLLARLLPESERHTILAELDTLFRRRLQRVGRARAVGWYLLRGLGFPIRLQVERLRGWRLASFADAWARDVRLAVRTLVRRPGYAVVGVLTLGVGVAALTTVYSAAHWVLLRPVPGVVEADGLATVQLEVRSAGSPAFPVSTPDLETFADRIGALTALEGSRQVDVDLDPETGVPPAA